MTARTDQQKTDDIIEALIAVSQDLIWASELRLDAGSRRVDFWTLAPTASQKFRSTSYEVKVSRADFNRDTEQKQSAALRISDRFWYVTPPGLVGKHELPDWAGLTEWDGDKRFSIKRRAPKLEKQEPSWDLIVSLMRNTADRGRDLSMLKNQLAWFKGRQEMQDRISHTRMRIENDRWMRKREASA